MVLLLLLVAVVKESGTEIEDDQDLADGGSDCADLQDKVNSLIRGLGNGVALKLTRRLEGCWMNF